MVDKSEEKEPILIFEENYSIPFFKTLNCSFGDSDNTISKMYKQCKDSLASQKHIDQKALQKLKANIDQSYQMLMSLKLKERYLRYLFLNYSLSQPNTIGKLMQNYCWYVFPFYVFAIEKEKIHNEATHIIIDNINFALTFHSKNNTILSIEAEGIKSIHLVNSEKIVLDFINKKEDVIVKPSIHQQVELVYTLLYFMKYTKEQINNEKYEMNIVKEKNQNLKSKPVCAFSSIKFQLEAQFKIDQLTLLRDDIYIPCGIILKGKLFYKTKNKPCFVIMGTSILGVFEDETLTTLSHFIPIVPYYTQIKFDHKKNSMSFINPQKEYVYLFESSDQMSIWQSTIYDLSEGKIDEKINEEQLNKIFFDKQYINQTHTKSLFIYNNLNNQIDEIEQKIAFLKGLKEKRSKQIVKDNHIKWK